MLDNYVDRHLDPDERVVYRASLHWIVYLGPVIVLGIGVVPAVTGYAAGGLALLVMGLIWMLAAWIRSISSEFAVTTRRVIIKTGFLSRRTIELNMSKVESVQVDQDILGRVLNYGTITVIGTGGTKEPFAMLDNPMGFRHAVQQELG